MLYKESEDGVEHLTPPNNEQEQGEIRQNLAGIKATIAVAGAKGGSGKSTLTVNLAAALAIKGRKVAIFDADLNSPSIATMLGMGRTQIYPVSGGIEPAAGPLGLRVIASDLLQDSAQAPFTFEETEAAVESNGNLKAETSETQSLRDFGSQTRFGALDYLFVDLANGLDHLLRLMDVLQPTGILMVTQPSELSVQATRRALENAGRVSLPMLGIVENMSGFTCGHCHSVRPLLPQGDTAGLARAFEVPLLARLPFDERMAECCDQGAPFVKAYPDLLLARQIVELAQKLEERVRARNVEMAARPAAI